MDNSDSASNRRGTRPARRVFISEPIHFGWIIEKLMRDLAAELNRRGIETQVGSPSAYAGQEIVFHSRYLYAAQVTAAKVNSLFITHIDDKLKEIELKSRIESFDSLVCTSQAEADVVCGLGCPKSKVLGLALPHRGGFVRRPRVAIFSERYKDGRKNEDWLIEYFQTRESAIRHSIVLCLIGHGWEAFCERLAALGLSFELYRYDRDLPGEYEIQKSILEGMNYLIYPGFDGGAMCVYDGITAGLDLIVSDNGYHRDLGSNANLFRTKGEFFERLDQIANATISRERLLTNRSIESYASTLVGHWNSILTSKMDTNPAHKPPVGDAPVARDQNEQLQFYRSHYKSLSVRRAASSLYRQCRHLLERLKTQRALDDVGDDPPSS